MAGLQNRPLNKPQAKRCKRRAWKIHSSKEKRRVDKDKISRKEKMHLNSLPGPQQHLQSLQEPPVHVERGFPDFSETPAMPCTKLAPAVTVAASLW